MIFLFCKSVGFCHSILLLYLFPGTCLGSELAFYLRQIRQKEKLKGFTVNHLRHALEIENALDQNSSENLSSHLGHNASTVKRYYLIKDPRHAVQAANRLMFIMEDIGEKEETKVSRITFSFFY